jgi:hypothetical protein
MLSYTIYYDDVKLGSTSFSVVVFSDTYDGPCNKDHVAMTLRVFDIRNAEAREAAYDAADIIQKHLDDIKSRLVIDARFIAMRQTREEVSDFFPLSELMYKYKLLQMDHFDKALGIYIGFNINDFEIRVKVFDRDTDVSSIDRRCIRAIMENIDYIDDAYKDEVMSQIVNACHEILTYNITSAADVLINDMIRAWCNGSDGCVDTAMILESIRTACTELENRQVLVQELLAEE